MIQTVHYRARLDGKDGEDVLAALNARLAGLLKGRRELLGASADIEGSTVILRLRIQASDTWNVTRAGRRMGTYLFSAVRVHFSIPLHPELIHTEPTRNKLRVGEGGTPRPRPPRTTPLPQ